MTRYEDIFFAQGEEADPYLDMVDKFGADVVLSELAECHCPGEHVTYNANPTGEQDETQSLRLDEQRLYILSWNSALQYIGLTCKPMQI